MDASFFSLNLNERNALLSDNRAFVKSAFNFVKPNTRLQYRESEKSGDQPSNANQHSAHVYKNNYQNTEQPITFQQIDIVKNKLLNSPSLIAASQSASNFLALNKTENTSQEIKKFASFLFNQLSSKKIVH
jgi:hypothetical protein